MTRLRFTGKINKMGDNWIVWIPKEYHDKVAKLRGKTLVFDVSELTDLK